MPESTYDYKKSGIPVLNADETPSGIYLYLDNVTKNGIATIIVRWNFREEMCKNEFDNTTSEKYVYNESWIKSWVLPGFYLKNGEMVQLGTIGSDGKRIVTSVEVKDYIAANAAEIAGFGQTAKIEYVR